MNPQEKTVLKEKYGHCKLLWGIHWLGRCIKERLQPSAKMIISGKNNRIPYKPKQCKIVVFGDNNTIDIHPSVTSWRGVISIGDRATPVQNCTVRIGKHSTSIKTDLSLFEDNSSILIGEGCMFSWDIYIWATDRHSIYSVIDEKLLNAGRKVVIGDHVWVGMHSSILKNSHIAKNSVVGAHAVVAKRFWEENCVLAGNPAKVVKRGINWSACRPKEYLKRQKTLK